MQTNIAMGALLGALLVHTSTQAAEQAAKPTDLRSPTLPTRLGSWTSRLQSRL